FDSSFAKLEELVFSIEQHTVKTIELFGTRIVLWIGVGQARYFWFTYVPKGSGVSVVRCCFFFQAEDGIRDLTVTGVQTCALPISSSGIGELVSGFTAVKNQGGDLKLLQLTKKVRDLLQITKLYTVFDVYTDEKEIGRASCRERV